MKKKKKKFGSIKFTKGMFINAMDEIQKQHEHDNKCGDAFAVILPDDFTTSYDNHYLLNKLLEIIKIAFNDNHKDSWIEYFVYDLNFGKEYIDGMITNKDGSHCNLANAGRLYDFMKENFKEK